MADECCRCTCWNKVTQVCHEPDSMFHRKRTTAETACDHIIKGEPSNVPFLRFCSTCQFFRRNHPKTPIFINGLWWGGADAGLCKKWRHAYETDQHRVDSDGCAFHQYSGEVLELMNTSEIPEGW